MSHVTTVKMRIRSLEALRKAAAKCGLEFKEGQTSFRWWQDREPTDLGECKHAMGVPNDALAYEIGVLAAKDGDGFLLGFDFFCQTRLKDLAGDNCDKLMQEYGMAVAEESTQDLQLAGWAAQRIEQPNGDVQLVLDDGGM